MASFFAILSSKLRCLTAIFQVASVFAIAQTKPRKLARNRGGNHGLQFPRMASSCDIHGKVAPGLPGAFSHWLAQLCARNNIATDTCWKTGSSMPPRSTCAAPAIARRRSPMLDASLECRRERDNGHELPRIGQRVMSPSSATSVAAATSARPRSARSVHHGRQPPVRQCGFDVGFNTYRRSVAASTAAMQLQQMQRAACSNDNRRASAGASGSRPAGHTTAMRAESGELARLPNTRTAAKSRGTRSRHDLRAGTGTTVTTAHLPMQLARLSRVASVGFDPIAGLARN